MQRKRRFARDRPQARAVENLRGSPAPRWKGLDALYTVDPKLPSPARSGADAGPSTSGTPVWRKRRTLQGEPPERFSSESLGVIVLGNHEMRVRAFLVPNCEKLPP